jgi:hypothetical protein
MKQTGHRSVSVVRRDIRDAELFDDNAALALAYENREVGKRNALHPAYLESFEAFSTAPHCTKARPSHRIRRHGQGRAQQ